jgi:hypothetical protein
MLPFFDCMNIFSIFVQIKICKMSIIRKISVGQDFPNGCMHYQVGKQMNLMGELHKIIAILKEVEEGVAGYNVYIEGETSTVKWKRIESMPVHIEMDITFD